MLLTDGDAAVGANLAVTQPANGTTGSAAGVTFSSGYGSNRQSAQRTGKLANSGTQNLLTTAHHKFTTRSP